MIIFLKTIDVTSRFHRSWIKFDVWRCSWYQNRIFQGKSFSQSDFQRWKHFQSLIVEFDFDWCDLLTERCPNPFPTRFGGSERFFLPFLKKYFTFYGLRRGSKIEDFQRIFLYTELGSIFCFQEEDRSCWMDLVNSLVDGECCCVYNWRYFFEDVGGVKNFSRGGKKLVKVWVRGKTVIK